MQKSLRTILDLVLQANAQEIVVDNHLLFPNIDEKTLRIMLKMRSLIHSEYGILISLHGEGALDKYCAYGMQSRYPELQKLARQLADTQGMAV